MAHESSTDLVAILRVLSRRQLRPTESHLASEGHQLLSTRFGPLDLLGVIGASQSYSDLIARTDEFEVEPFLRVRALALEALIEVKEAAGREKDLVMLPYLRRTLEQR